MKGQPSIASITRRRVLAGTAAFVAALGLTPTASGAKSATDADLIVLGKELDRLRHRCGRLHRKARHLADLAGRLCDERAIQPRLPDHRRNPAFDAARAELGYDRAWKRWSDAVNVSLDLAERIGRAPAVGIPGFAVKHRALMWELFHHEMALALDDIHLRRLNAFGRELERHAREAPG